jgi:hypothetical protein
MFQTRFTNPLLSKICFILSISILVFWILGKATDVYHFALTGAIFELLWLPMLFMLFVLPVLSLVSLIREKFNLRSLYLYSIILNTANILLMIFIK